MKLRIPRPLAWCAGLVLGLAAGSPAHATITPEAQAVVERYIEATGGRAALDRVGSLYMRMTIEAFGFKGTAEAWTVAPDREASDVTLGPFHVRDGYDGARGWRLDPSGKLLKLDGKDLEDAVAGAWFANERWLAPDQGGGNVTLVGQEKDSTGTFTVLEVAPPAGRSRRMYIDPGTGLVARVVAIRDVHTMVTTNSEWRVIGGRKVATRAVQAVVGMPANTVTQTLDTLQVNVEVPSSRFAPPDEQPAAMRWLRKEGEAQLPFEYRGRHVWVRGSIDGGPPADFIFDTGASMTVLDSAYAARIGLKPEGAMEGQGASASGNVSFARLKTLRLESPAGDGIELQDVKVGVLSINAVLAPFFWRDCAGIIGFNVLGRFVDRIDYDARTLTFYEPRTFAYAGRGARVPFRLAGSIPAVSMTVDGRYTGEFRIDVGSSSTVDLHTPFVKQHGLLAKAKRRAEVMGGGFGGTFTSTLTRMGSLTLGPYTWKGALVSLQSGGTGMLASADYAGNVGNQILDRFTLTIDYERRVLWLEPGKGVGRRDAFSRLGAQLVLIDGAVRVGQLLPGSPAEKAGLRDRDEVVTIDGRPALDYGPDAINRMFEERRAGTRTVFEVRRDGALVKRVATLADIL